MAYGKRRVSRRSTRRTYRRKRTQSSKRGVARANRAIRMVKALSKRVAGEVCKFESTPNMYSNLNVTNNSSTSWTTTVQTPLTTIQSGVPWIMPLNWIYTSPSSSATLQYPTAGSTVSIAASNGVSINGEAATTLPVGTEISVKNPIWYNTIDQQVNINPYDESFEVNGKGTDYQYRYKYMYLNALFNASLTSSTTNNDGAMRVVLVKDKQATGGSATWFDANDMENARGVFNAQRIDAQLNPSTVGRFKILYDKTLRFNTINGYKPFKLYRKLSTIVRNNRGLIDSVGVSSGVASNVENGWQTNDQSPPVQKNAYYLMIFSDGLNFTYTNDSITAPGTFHLFNRIAYYNN